MCVHELVPYMVQVLHELCSVMTVKGHPPVIRSRQRGPQKPGHQQSPQSTEPRKPTAGTTTHPPRRPQRKPPDRAPTAIGQRPPRNQGRQPTGPARPRPHSRLLDPGPISLSTNKSPGRGPTQYPRGPSTPDSPAQWASACPSAPVQVPWESRRAHRWVKPRAAGRGNAPPPSGAAQAGPRTASTRPRPSHHQSCFCY